MKRVSKGEWLQVALDLLEKEGVEAVRVERLARELGIAKSGFYWHFKNREDLRSQMLDYWAHEFTEVVSSNPRMSSAPPCERLERMMLMILDHDLTRYEVAIRGWAAEDAAIARRVRDVYRLRMDYVQSLFHELGFRGDDLTMRTRLCVCYHTWERPMFWKESKKSLRKLIRKRVELLTKK